MLDRSVLLRMYEVQTTIKQCDERFRSLLMSGRISFAYHSPRGQEVISAAVTANLRPDDYLVTTYRGLHDHIAKGVPLRALWAEFLGKASGTNKGKGGPMHVTHPASGLVVTTGVVGAGLPIANGLALASVMDGTDRVTSVSFGDGAANTGAFHEALNLASVWKLPVVFVCHNNQYAEHTALCEATSVEHIAERATAYTMAGETVDGNDPVAVHDAVKVAVDRARRGGGPTLLEAVTYRFWGHVLGDAMEYMPAEERSAAIATDPVPRYRQWLVDHAHATDEELAAVDDAARLAIEDAADHALASPFPLMDELVSDVFAEAGPQ